MIKDHSARSLAPLHGQQGIFYLTDRIVHTIAFVEHWLEQEIAQ